MMAIVFFFFFFFSFYFAFWLYYVVCGILVSWPGIKPVSPAVVAWSRNHWTVREVPSVGVFKKDYILILGSFVLFLLF